jgi:hypothetical protein
MADYRVAADLSCCQAKKKARTLSVTARLVPVANSAGCLKDAGETRTGTSCWVP